jgi:hypothetical protein
MYSNLSPEQRVPLEHPLRAIREIVDAVLKRMSPEFGGPYAAALEMAEKRVEGGA